MSGCGAKSSNSRSAGGLKPSTPACAHPAGSPESSLCTCCTRGARDRHNACPAHAAVLRPSGSWCRHRHQNTRVHDSAPENTLPKSECSLKTGTRKLVGYRYTPTPQLRKTQCAIATSSPVSSMPQEFAPSCRLCTRRTSASLPGVVAVASLRTDPAVQLTHNKRPDTSRLIELE